MFLPWNQGGDAPGNVTTAITRYLLGSTTPLVRVAPCLSVLQLALYGQWLPVHIAITLERAQF